MTMTDVFTGKRVRMPPSNLEMQLTLRPKGFKVYVVE
jgi:hypothetical protein